MSSKIDIPSDVKNPINYKNYLKLNQQAEDSKYYVSDEAPDLSINLLTPHAKLHLKLQDFSDKERENVLKKANKVRSLFAKAHSQKNKAYGVKQNGAQSFNQSRLDPYKDDIIELFGQMYTTKEVLAIVNNQYKIDVTKAALNRFRIKYKEIIDERIIKHQQDFTAVRLSHKKSRLLELSQLFYDRKAVYLKTKHKDDYQLLLKTLAQINKEVEGDKLTIEGNLDININATIDMKLHQEVMNKMPIIDIVIARVAGKQGLNPTYLISRLHDSVYSRFNGFGSESAEKYEQVIYPSSETFDVEYVKTRQQDLNRQKKMLQQILPPQSIANKTSAEIKEALLAKIRRDKQDLDDSIERIQKKN